MVLLMLSHGGNHYTGESGGIGTITIGTDSSSYTTGGHDKRIRFCL